MCAAPLPSQGVFTAKQKEMLEQQGKSAGAEQGDAGDDSDEDEDEAALRERVRMYERSKLRYYYAIVSVRLALGY